MSLQWIPFFEPESGFSNEQKEKYLSDYQSLFSDKWFFKAYFGITVVFVAILSGTLAYIMKDPLPLIAIGFMLVLGPFLWLINRPFLIAFKRSIRKTGSLFSGFFGKEDDVASDNQTYKTLKGSLILSIFALLLFAFATHFVMLGAMEIGGPKISKDVSAGWQNIKYAMALYCVCGFISFLLYMKIGQIHD